MSFHVLESVNWTGYKLVYGKGVDYEYYCCRDLTKVGQFKSLDVRTITSSYKVPPIRSLLAQTEQVALRAYIYFSWSRSQTADAKAFFDVVCD